MQCCIEQTHKPVGALSLLLFSSRDTLRLGLRKSSLLGASEPAGSQWTLLSLLRPSWPGSDFGSLLYNLLNLLHTLQPLGDQALQQSTKDVLSGQR